MKQPNVIPGACMLLSQVIHVPPGSNQPQSMTHGAGCWASTTIGRYSASKASQQEVPDSLSRFELILAPTHSWRNCNVCVFYTHRESLPTVPHFYSEDCPLPLCLAPSDFEADKRQPAKVIAFPPGTRPRSHIRLLMRWDPIVPKLQLSVLMELCPLRWVSCLLGFYQKYLAWMATNNSRLWEGIKWLMLYLGSGTLGTRSRLRTLWLISGTELPSPPGMPSALASRFPMPEPDLSHFFLSFLRSLLLFS